MSLLLLPLLSSGCSRSPSLYQDQFLAFGTVVSISTWGASESQNREASRLIRADFAAMHDTWHAWKAGGLLGEINQNIAAGLPTPISEEAAQLLKKSATLSTKSSDLFNPAIGKLIALWGFHGESWTGPPPPQSTIDPLLKSKPRMDQLQFENGTLRSSNPAVQIDLGGIAKGYAVDRAIEQLKQLGIRDAIVNTGGDLRAIGSHGRRNWNIGIRAPDGGDPIASIQPQGDESIFTSGDYERMFLYQGERYHHIIDPTTGWPATGTRSVTVIHPDATTADAAATALLVASPTARTTVAQQLGIDKLLIIDDHGRLHLTESMAQRLNFHQQPPPIVERLVIR
ncbi:MAG: FAD:protein FMN transferase [Gammaproteobacteria bacterium]|nr:FAD:protein FMN transferase [Gammaproteobacteria bacterium]